MYIPSVCCQGDSVRVHVQCACSPVCSRLIYMYLYMYTVFSPGFVLRHKALPFHDCSRFCAIYCYCQPCVFIHTRKASHLLPPLPRPNLSLIKAGLSSVRLQSPSWSWYQDRYISFPSLVHVHWSSSDPELPLSLEGGGAGTEKNSTQTSECDRVHS